MILIDKQEGLVFAVWGPDHTEHRWGVEEDTHKGGIEEEMARVGRYIVLWPKHLSSVHVAPWETVGILSIVLGCKNISILSWSGERERERVSCAQHWRGRRPRGRNREYRNRGQKERAKQKEGRLTLHGTKRGGGEKEMGHSDKPKHYLS